MIVSGSVLGFPTVTTALSRQGGVSPKPFKNAKVTPFRDIKICTYMYRLIQFADDTTIILDGTTKSLQATNIW